MGAPGGADDGLRSAAALVFVADPTDPVPEPEDRHHLVRVLRLRPGERVAAADGRGTWVPCRFRDHPGERVLEVDGPARHTPAPAPALSVAFAPVKAERPEWVVQKLTEIGIDRIVVTWTARSVVRWPGDRAEKAGARLARVAREAAAQCRRVWLPRVDQAASLADVVDGPGGRWALAEPGAPAPWAGLSSVAVGPEGGWSPGELGAAPATVGLAPHVLRAETAALAAGVLLVALRAGTVEVRSPGDGG